MRRLLPACLLLMMSAIPAAWSQAEKDSVCATPADLTTPSAPLTYAATALAKTGMLDILALGSGSTVGDSGGLGGPALVYKAPAGSFPMRMLEALRAGRPAAKFNLTVAGGRSMTADGMLPILHHELATHHYDLVLWQTGTVEAVQGMRPDALRGVLQDGADAIADAHADLVLIDPQYSRFLRANADLSPYETVLVQMTSSSGATLFRRFDLTQSWVNAGQVDVERVSLEMRDKTIMSLNDCLGQALARYVLAGAELH